MTPNKAKAPATGTRKGFQGETNLVVGIDMKDTANKPALQGIEAMQIFARASWDAFQACKDSLSEARREEIHRLTYELWEEVGAAVKEARLAVHEAAFQQFKVKLTKRPHGNSKLAKDLKQEVGHEH